MTGFDPTATLAITNAAQAAYLASGVPEHGRHAAGHLGCWGARSTQPFRVTPELAGEALWMPRVSAAYKLTERMVVKAGYGVYYDTLNAADFGANQTG